MHTNVELISDKSKSSNLSSQKSRLSELIFTHFTLIDFLDFE